MKNYTNSLACSFNAKRKNQTLIKSEMDETNKRDDLSYSGQKFDSISKDFRRKRRFRGKEMKSIDSNIPKGMSLLNLKEEAFKMYCQDMVSQNIQSKTMISVKSGNLKNKIKESKKGYKPRGRDLLHKIGLKSKSPDKDEPGSQETKKNWGRYENLFMKKKVGDKEIKFCSGETVEGVMESVELKELRNKVKLKRIHDILNLKSRSLSNDSQRINIQEDVNNFETKKTKFKVQHLDKNFSSDKKFFKFYDSNDSHPKSSKKKILENMLLSKNKNSLKSKSKNIFNKKIINRNTKINMSKNSFISRNLRSKKQTYTGKKKTRKFHCIPVKFKREVKGKLILFEGVMNYSSASKYMNKVKLVNKFIFWQNLTYISNCLK